MEEPPTHLTWAIAFAVFAAGFFALRSILLRLLANHDFTAIFRG